MHELYLGRTSSDSGIGSPVPENKIRSSTKNPQRDMRLRVGQWRLQQERHTRGFDCFGAHHGASQDQLRERVAGLSHVHQPAIVAILI